MEDSDLLKRPRAGRDFPRRMLLEKRLGFAEIRLVVGPKKEPRPLPCAARDDFEKIRLKQAIFVMPAFWPRIREENINIGQRRAWREAIHEVASLGVNEVEIGEFRPISLPEGPRDAFPADVEAEAKLIWVRGGIRGEKMTMAAAKLADEMGRRRKQACNLPLQIAAPLRQAGQILGRPNGVIHDD